MSKAIKQIYPYAALFALAGFLAACAPTGKQNLQATDIWARPALAGGNSAVYFSLENRTGSEDRLLTTSSDVAEAVEIHMTSMQDGNMQMMLQHEVPVRAGKTEFKPGGLHVMLVGLKQDLNPGDTFSLTLNFAASGAMPLEVMVSEP